MTGQEVPAGRDPDVRFIGAGRRELNSRIIRMYTKDRMTIRAIAAEVVVSYSYAHGTLEEAGVEFRSTGSSPAATKATRDQVKEIIRRYAVRGESVRVIAAAMGVSRRVVDGVLKLPSSQKFVDADRRALNRRIIRMYTKDGMTVRAIATEVGVSYGYAYRTLEEAEVEFRSTGPSPAATRVNRAQTQEIIDRYTVRGESMRAIAAAMGVTRRVVEGVLNRPGSEVTIRTRGGAACTADLGGERPDPEAT